jgi:Spherulation-specific family 4
MIRVVCTCGRAFKTEDRHAGKQTKCPVCGADLTVGATSEARPSSSGGDGTPTWWDANNPPGPAARGTAPTRSGSDPGPDAVGTTIVPPGSDRPPQRRASTPAGAPPAHVPPPKAPAATWMQVPGRLSWLAGNRRAVAVAGGAAACVLVAFVAFLWLRQETPGAGGAAPAPPGVESGKPGDVGQSQPSVPVGDPGSSEKPSARSTAAGGTDTSRPGPTVDANGPPKASPAGESRRLRLLVPAYIYPGGEGRREWQRLFDAAAKVEIIAIANPNSGPGEASNPDYHSTFTEANIRGIKLVGYVSTDFGRRPQADVKKDVDTWLIFYPQVRGFFFDQQPRDGQYAAQFAELRDYARRKLLDAIVVTNPGIPCDEAYLAQKVSDLTCVFVNFEGFERFELPAALKKYEPPRFAALPYNIPDVETMRAFVKEAIVKRIGYIYVSDATQPNPWSKLPAYWEAEVDAVSRLR